MLGKLIWTIRTPGWRSMPQRQTLIAVLDDATKLSPALCATLARRDVLRAVIGARPSSSGPAVCRWRSTPIGPAGRFIPPRREADRSRPSHPRRPRPRPPRDRAHRRLLPAGARAWRTPQPHLQDRLVNELRLAGITTVAAANAYLQERFIPDYNATFTRVPADPTSAFVPLGNVDLDQILCEEAERIVGQDNVVSFESVPLQLAKQPGRSTWAGDGSSCAGTLMLPIACGAARSAWAASRPTGPRSHRASSAAPPGSSALPAPPSRRGPPTPSSVGAAPPAAALAHGCPSARACETGQITCQTRADRSLVSNMRPAATAASTIPTCAASGSRSPRSTSPSATSRATSPRSAPASSRLARSASTPRLPRAGDHRLPAGGPPLQPAFVHDNLHALAELVKASAGITVVVGFVDARRHLQRGRHPPRRPSGRRLPQAVPAQLRRVRRGPLLRGRHRGAVFELGGHLVRRQHLRGHLVSDGPTTRQASPAPRSW